MTIYTHSFKERVLSSPESIGTLLAKEAMRLDVAPSVLQAHIGVSKQTLYNWFRGGNIARPYRRSVELTLEAMAKSNTQDEVLKQLCQSLPPKHLESTSFSVLQKKLALMKTGAPYKKKF